MKDPVIEVQKEKVYRRSSQFKIKNRTNAYTINWFVHMNDTFQQFPQDQSPMRRMTLNPASSYFED